MPQTPHVAASRSSAEWRGVVELRVVDHAVFRAVGRLEVRHGVARLRDVGRGNARKEIPPF